MMPMKKKMMMKVKYTPGRPYLVAGCSILRSFVFHQPSFLVPLGCDSIFNRHFCYAGTFPKLC